MRETDRQLALAAVQLRLFDLAKERKQLKLCFLALVAAHTKVCRDMKCESRGEPMQADQFYVDDRYSDNLYPYCRECKTRMVKARQRKAA